MDRALITDMMGDDPCVFEQSRFAIRLNTTAARFPISIEKGTTGRDLHLKAWAIQLGTSTFVGQYTHAKTKATFSVKVRVSGGVE